MRPFAEGKLWLWRRQLPLTRRTQPDKEYRLLEDKVYLIQNPRLTSMCKKSQHVNAPYKRHAVAQYYTIIHP